MRFYAFSTLLCVLFVSTAARRRVKRSAFGKSLYSPEDSVVQLDVGNFDETILGANAAFAVEFYKDWCGHCRAMKPIIVEFAKDIKNWSNVVKIATINCANHHNEKLCKDNGIRGVPSLKYFPRNSHSYKDAFIVEADRSVDKLRKSVSDAVVEEYDLKHYSDWPNFDHIHNTNSSLYLWNDIPANINKLMLIFEAQNSETTANQLLLDLNQQNLTWLAARKAKWNNELVDILNIVDFPSVAIFERGRDEAIYISEIRHLLSEDLTKFLVEFFQPTTAGPPATTLSAEARKAKYYASETDMLLSIWYALYEEVPGMVKKRICCQNMTVLKDFVKVLKLYYPRKSAQTMATLNRSWRAVSVFKDLDVYLADKHNITTSEWKSQFRLIEQKYGNPFPTESDFDHCRGSSAEYRGFSCGLWMNFHALTVHAFLTDGKSPDFDPLKVLYAIQGWVKVFFSCRDCSDHFMEMTTEKLKMEDHVKNPSDAFMYLWDAHNMVNRRLSGDTTEDPSFPKLQFPAPFLCAECSSEPKIWDTVEVKQFIIDFYTYIHAHKTTNIPVLTRKRLNRAQLCC